MVSLFSQCSKRFVWGVLTWRQVCHLSVSKQLKRRPCWCPKPVQPLVTWVKTLYIGTKWMDETNEKTAAVLLPKPSKLVLLQGYADWKPLRWLTQPIWFKDKNVLTLLNASKTTTTSSHRLQQWLPTVVASTPHPSPAFPSPFPPFPYPFPSPNYIISLFSRLKSKTREIKCIWISSVCSTELY